MIAKFFNKSRPINTLTILILLLFVFILGLITHPEAQITISYLGKRLLDLCFVGITLFVINFIIRKNDLTKENTFSLFILICFLGLFPKTMADRGDLVVHFLLLMAFRRIYSLKSLRNTKEKLFDAGFWIGIVCLLNPLSLIYLLLIYSALISYKKISPRNMLIPIVGIITPIFIYGVYLFAVDRLDELVLEFAYDISLNSYNALPYFIGLTLLIGFLIWTIIPTTIKIMTIKLELKATWYVVLMNLFLGFLFIILQVQKNGAELIYLFFPSAIIFTNYLQQTDENWFKEVFLYLFLAAAMLVNFL